MNYIINFHSTTGVSNDPYTRMQSFQLRLNKDNYDVCIHTYIVKAIIRLALKKLRQSKHILSNIYDIML